MQQHQDVTEDEIIVKKRKRRRRRRRRKRTKNKRAAETELDDEPAICTDTGMQRQVASPKASLNMQSRCRCSCSSKCKSQGSEHTNERVAGDVSRANTRRLSHTKSDVVSLKRQPSESTPVKVGQSTSTIVSLYVARPQAFCPLCYLYIHFLL
eukprot:SAG31_NODE_6079_length_2180_cov_1.318116_1_plen_153_part_00